ncbi:MAG: fumarylacetoacetate hydrolase family protein [Victivallaceae bacterium]|nr:fumarylacetoacetate hydrolase family protein [Victivallaceae bacterium]
MKYLRFKDAQHPDGCLGQLEGDTVKILKGCIFAGNLQETGESAALDSIESFLPPVDSPNIIAIGANYVDHCKECDAKLPENPLVFIKTTNSLTAHGENIVLPRNNPDEVDYEAELAVVIGKTASYVSEADAMDYVLGFTCANDVSARDVQLKIDSQWARGKSFDSFCPLGPYLVTGIRDVEDLHVKLRLNGELMQDQPVSDMIFSITRVIAHLSAGITLLPGTVILTGTPAGVGMARDPRRFLRSGDVVEVEIDQIGALRNRVVAHS